MRSRQRLRAASVPHSLWTRREDGSGGIADGSSDIELASVPPIVINSTSTQHPTLDSNSKSFLNTELHLQPELSAPMDRLNIYPSGGNANDRRPSLLQIGVQKLEHHCCRINVLLVSMQVGLGGSMSMLSIYLQTKSPDITWRESSYWASLPLFIIGLSGLYFCGMDQRMYSQTKLSRFVRTFCMTTSFFSTFSSLASSLVVGYYGNRIARYSTDCDNPTNSEATAVLQCCGTREKVNFNVSCQCYFNQSVHFAYHNFDCRYVVSALKDYFILQCALMGVATFVCLWFAHILWRAHQLAEQLRSRNYPAAPPRLLGWRHKMKTTTTTTSSSSSSRRSHRHSHQSGKASRQCRQCKRHNHPPCGGSCSMDSLSGHHQRRPDQPPSPTFGQNHYFASPDNADTIVASFNNNGGQPASHSLASGGGVLIPRIVVTDYSSDKPTTSRVLLP